jgi:hypothetical protein
MEPKARQGKEEAILKKIKFKTEIKLSESEEIN